MNYMLKIQASYANRDITQRLEDFVDAVVNDKSLSSYIKDQLLYLRYGDACELTSIISKFREQLSTSHYTHPEVQRTILFLDISIQSWAKILDVNTLFLCYLYRFQ